MKINQLNDETNEARAYLVFVLICSIFGFLASYCYGLINEQNYILARSTLWAIVAFVASVTICIIIAGENNNKK